MSTLNVAGRAIPLKVAAIIPARMSSTRFPGKPLVKILGLEMIEHVRRRVERIPGLSHVIVATCDQEIVDLVEKNGGKAVMTSDKHERACDRIEEAARNLDADIVINVQGDEPMVSAEAIEELIAPFRAQPDVQCTNLVYRVLDFSELTSDNVVKVALSKTGKILYFSRLGLPGRKVEKDFPYFKQSGIMAFRKDFLHKFTALAPTPLEEKESVDLLRLLEHDYPVQAVISKHETKGIDVPSQVAEVEKAILEDPAQKKIFNEICNEKR